MAWRLWLSSPHPAVRAAAAGAAGCLVIEATAIHALALNADVFGRELLLPVAFIVAVSIGGGLPVRALGLSSGPSMATAWTAFPSAFLLLAVATKLLSPQAPAEASYAAIVVLGLTLSLLVVLAKRGRQVLAPLIIGALGGAATLLALMVVSDGRSAFQLTLVVWLALPAVARLLLRDASA